jgi:hypothetical protein
MKVLLQSEISAPERENDKELRETFFTSSLVRHAVRNAKSSWNNWHHTFYINSDWLI